MQVEDWMKAEQVTVDASRMSTNDRRDMYLWIIDHVGIKNKDWVWLDELAGSFTAPTVFAFADPRHAFLFQLTWSHVCTKGTK